MSGLYTRLKTVFRRGKLPRFLFCCLASFGVLAVCTKSSFLYPMNDWVDVNCFFTVGRGLLHGLTPYLDLYEQKGPLVYFVYAVAGLISENSFLGVYLLEGLFFAWFLHLGGRITETLSGRKRVYFIAVPLLAALIPVTPAFSHGGSAEEFFLPVFALGLLPVLRAMRENRALCDRDCFVLGLCAAAALWTKYTFCGFFAGLAAAVLIWMLCTGKARDLPRMILFCLAGFLALSAVIAGFFALRGALDDLWQAYFVNNLTAYSQNVRGGHYDEPLPNLLNNLPWSLPGVLGLIYLAVRIRKHGWQALTSWLAAVCLFVFTYWNNRRYPYYALVLAVFAPLGFGALGSILRPLAERCRPKAVSLAAGILSAVLLLAGPAVAYTASPNTYLMSVRKEDMPQYRFAERILESSDTSLLNYGFLDGGFYFAAGVLPESPFFCTLNIDLPEMENALQNSVREGRTAWLVIRGRPLRDSGVYELVDEAEMYFEGREWTYCLYRRISAGE